jgi:DNA-binding CsgD family transcriptional regulator/GAF domain-containing protein
VSERTSNFLDSARLLLGLQQGNQIARSLSGCLEPEAIATQVTEGLVEKFNCAFARIWIVEPDRISLKLVASSGMYTRLDGSFAQVPMGAFKVGKIAQHCIPFLSNHLAEETWVKDRDWAIRHKIQGFAGYPLVATGGVIGVLAVFSQQAMEPEFLEILQGLCATVTVALDTALQYQQEKQVWQSSPKRSANPSASCIPLSEQLANLLQSSRLALLGTERALTASLTCLFLRSGEILSQMHCIHSRLTYGSEQISLEAMVAIANHAPDELTATFGELLFAASCLGGTLQTYTEVNQTVLQVVLTVPYPVCILGARLRIQCRSPVLQMAFTQLAYSAGLTVDLSDNQSIPLLTDDLIPAQTASVVLWVSPTGQVPPKNAKAKLDLSINSGQLREAIAAVTQGERWGLDAPATQSLSEREQEILALLVQGLRDRDIASQLILSESTVKFHMNNILTKLKVRTRYQAIYQAIANGWLV